MSNFQTTPDPYTPPIDPYSQPNDDDSGKLLRRGALVVAIFALIAGVAVVLNFSVLDDTADGFATPEAAGEAFFEALGQEDPLGVLQTIAPSEYEAWVKPQTALFGELVRLGVFESDTLNGDQISLGDALKIEVTRPFEFETRQYFEETDELYEVTVIDGQLTITFDENEAALLLGEESPGTEPATSKVTFGPLSVETIEDGESTINNEPLRMMVVKESGSYFLSLGHTIAEYIRVDEGAIEPSYARRLQPAGADSPEEAMNQMMELLLQGRMEAVMATLDPAEFKAVYNYWSLLAGDALDVESQVLNFKAESGFDWDVQFESASENRDGRTQVWLTAMTADITAPGFTANVELRENLLSATGEGAIDGVPTTFDLLIESNDSSAVIDFSFEVDQEFFDGKADINLKAQNALVTATSSEGDINFEALVEEDCLVVTGTVFGEPIDDVQCDLGLGENPLADQLKLDEIFDDMKQLGFHAVERDGKWYIGGVPTITYMAVDILKAIDDEELQQFEDWIDAIAQEIDGSLLLESVASDNFEAVANEIAVAEPDLSPIEEDIDFFADFEANSLAVEATAVITACSVEESFGSQYWTAQVELTNPLSEDIETALVDVRFVSNNTVVGNGTAFFDLLSPGETGSSDAVLYDDVQGDLICEIAGATAY